MRIVVDVEGLQNEGLLTPSVAELLRIHAVRDGSSVAITCCWRSAQSPWQVAC